MTTHPIKKDMSIFVGSVFEEQFTFVEDDETTPIDLTGCEMHMQVRATLASEDVLVELSTEDGTVELTDPANGAFRLILTAPDTDDLAAVVDAVYDLKVTPASGPDDEYTLLTGKVQIIGEVTRV